MGPRRVRLGLSAFLFVGFITSCTPFLVGPGGPESSLLIGRLVVNNNHVGSLRGLLPIGVLDRGLDLEIASQDRSETIKVMTTEQGYFFLPNLPPNNYYVSRVTLMGSDINAGWEKFPITMRRLPFAPVPGKIIYIGSLFLEVSERGEIKTREAREEAEARTYFLQRYSASPWSSREFASLGSGTGATAAVPPTKIATGETKGPTSPGPKAEKPEWKLGYEWRYAWKQNDRSGTYTSEIIREDTFEGIPSYVTRIGKNESYYAKDVLGVVARRAAGQLEYKRSSPRVNYLWPLEVGKVWTNSYLLERIQERSSQSFNYRMSVARMETVTVPAGTFETFKVEVYIQGTGKLFAEYWYSPTVKRAVKEREFLDAGVREEELVSFKVD